MFSSFLRYIDKRYIADRITAGKIVISKIALFSFVAPEDECGCSRRRAHPMARFAGKTDLGEAADCANARSMNKPLSAATLPSACPHDCPSTCALDVEVLDGKTVGRVRGAADNSYTAGVICAKVARYAERIHHPERLLKPLQRVGEKGAGEWREISWEDALDHVAEAVPEGRGAARLGGGLALSLCRHDGPRAARRHPPPAPRQALFEPVRYDLHQHGLDRLVRRHRRDARLRPARDGGL